MKRFCSLVSAVVCLSVESALFAQNAGPIVLDGVAAEVGGRRITIADVLENVRDELNMRGISGADASFAAKEMYAPALSNLVDRQLVLLKYEKLGKKLPAWYLNQRVEKIIEERFNGDRSQLVEMLNAHGISYEVWRSKIEDDTVVMTMRQQFVNQKVIVKPEEIRAEYDKNYKTKKLAGPVRVQMIQMRPEGKTHEQIVADAKALAARLQGGDDFAAAAREFSCEQHAQKGGDWGYVAPAEEFRREIADALSALRVGDVSNPVVIGDSLVYILRKADERADLSMPYDMVAADIERDIRESYIESRYRAWVDSLAKDFTVRIYQRQ